MGDVIAFGADPVGVVILEVVGDEVVHVDVLEDDRIVVGQCDVGVAADLRGDVEDLAEIPRDRNAHMLPAETVEVDPVFIAIAGREIGDGERAVLVVAPAPELERVVAGSAGDDVVAAVCENRVVAASGIDHVVAVGGVNMFAVCGTGNYGH